jgi:hypothetical protein
MEASQSTNRTYSILTETGNWFLHAEQTQGPDGFGAPIERRPRSASTSSGAADERRRFAPVPELVPELVSIDNGTVRKPKKGEKGGGRTELGVAGLVRAADVREGRPVVA